jgi:16S rRNA (cytidine1402-2'-O)-methyltransferase
VRATFSFQGDAGVGKLYLVATPIGNLGDMTYRAVETLRMAGVIAAEDTRQTRKLLHHFEIEGPRLVSYHEHNKKGKEEVILEYLRAGTDVALVSDAGTPGISDPGADLVKAAVAEGIPVVPVPGAVAGISALIASGLPTDRFTFVGFLPREKKKRLEELTMLKTRRETLVFYEAPHRVEETVKAMWEVFGDREIVLGRELTKRFEEFSRGKLSECVQAFSESPPRGEYVLVVAGADPELEIGLETGMWWEKLNLSEHVEKIVESGVSKKEAIKLVAKERGLSKRDVYQAVMVDQDADE